jgi:hypothetical protein
VGVQIENKLNFKEQLDMIVRTKIMIYKIVIGSSSIIFMTNKGEMRFLQLLQNGAMRIIVHIFWYQPEYLNDKITYNRAAKTRILRNRDDFRLPTYKKTYTQNSMWYGGIKLFNKLTPAMNEE